MRYVRLPEGAQREKSQGSLPIQGRPRKALRGKKALSSQLSSAFSLSQTQSAEALRQHAAEELKQLYLSGARPWSPLRGAGNAAAAHQHPARCGPRSAVGPKESEAGWAKPAAMAGEPGLQGCQSVPSAMAASKGRLEVSDDRFLSLLEKATRLAELAQQAKPQNRRPVVSQETAAAKAQKQRHGQEAAEKASAKLALKARLGMQNAKLSVSLPASLAVRVSTYRDNEVERIQLGRRCEIWKQEQAHHSEVSIACGRIDHVTLNAVAFQARPSTAPPQKPSRPLSCQTQRVRPATASAAGTATRRRLSPSAGPCGLYSSMSFGVLDSDTESEPGATSQVRTQRAVARFQGQTAPRDKLFPLAVQPEELQWPWPELSGTPGGTLRLSADAASAEAGTCPAIAGGLRAATNGEPDSVGLQLVGSSRGVDGSRFVRPQTAGTTRTGRRLTSRRPGSAPALPNMTNVDAKLVQMALPGMGGSPTKRPEFLEHTMRSRQTARRREAQTWRRHVQMEAALERERLVAAGLMGPDREAEAAAQLQRRQAFWATLVAGCTALQVMQAAVLRRRKTAQEVKRRREAAVLIATTWKRRRQARYNHHLFHLVLTIKQHLGPAVRRARLRLRQRAAGSIMTFLQQMENSNKLVAYVRMFCQKVRRIQNAWRGLRAIREAQRELLLLQLQRFEAQRTRQSRFAEEPVEAAAAAAGGAGGQVSSTQWGGSPPVGAAPAAAPAGCVHSPPDVPTAKAAWRDSLRQQKLVAVWVLHPGLPVAGPAQAAAAGGLGQQVRWQLERAEKSLGHCRPQPAGTAAVGNTTAQAGTSGRAAAGAGVRPKTADASSRLPTQVSIRDFSSAGDLGASLRQPRQVGKEVYNPTGTLSRSARLSRREGSLGPQSMQSTMLRGKVGEKVPQDILCSVVDSTIGELRQDFNRAVEEYWKKREVYHMQMAIEEVRLDLMRSANKAAVSTLVPPERPQYRVLQSKERLRMMLAQAQQIADEKRSDGDRARLKAAEEDARMAAWSSRRIKELT